MVGNPQGKATLVEFFDYNCGYCKRSLDDISKLMKTEPELKVVLKDFPVLGPGSVEAAQVAGAVRNQLKGDKFWPFTTSCCRPMGRSPKPRRSRSPRISASTWTSSTRTWPSREDPQRHPENMEIADLLSLTGTPTFVLGQDVVEGAVGYDQLKARVDGVLKCGKSICS